MKQDITDIQLESLSSRINALGLKRYTASQLVSWLYKKRVASFDEMTNLSKAAKRILSEKYFIGGLKIITTHKSHDGTQKFVFELRDGNKIESVVIPATDRRNTLCISTQVGCAMGCLLCRTAKMGFIRNLSQGEILGQLIEVQNILKEVALTNIVLMGMGEPLANFDSVASSVQIILDERAFNFSKRRVTLSTSGLLPQLENFSKKFGIKLAVSLNATSDEVRSEIMPINRRYNIDKIMKFCRDYTKKSKNYITFEYVMIRDVNDTKQDIKRLIKLLNGIRSKVNLIPFNPFPGTDLEGPLESTVNEWFEVLTKKGIQTNIRASRGKDILAACGQLAA